MHSKGAKRRRHSDELKAKVLSECGEPGASVAAVAQAYGLNANLVHKRRREGRARAAAACALVSFSIRLAAVVNSTRYPASMAFRPRETARCVLPTPGEAVTYCPRTACRAGSDQLSVPPSGGS